MNVDEVRKYCLAFPDATENLQWGDAPLLQDPWKDFADRWPGQSRLCFKCTAEMFAELIEREDIHPAPYVGRYNWVMLDRLDAVRNEELKDLLRQSYDMVAAKGPEGKARQARDLQGKKAAKKKAALERARRPAPEKR